MSSADGVMLILASRSPRRGLLLREAGYRFIQADPPFDDPAHPESSPRPGQSPRQLAENIAAAKAVSFRHSPLWRAHRRAVVVAADTLVVHGDGSLAGTPRSRHEAEAMIRRMIGVRHAVVSAAAIWRAEDDQPHTMADTAWVDVGAIDEVALNAYLDSGQWRGKAGGYNLLERQEAGWPISVTGDAATVVGLPMSLLTERLQAWGVTPSAAGSGQP
jgi:septum formation protein